MCIARNCTFWFGSVDDRKPIATGYYWEISDIDHYENAKTLKCFGVLYNGELTIRIFKLEQTTHYFWLWNNETLVLFFVQCNFTSSCETYFIPS